MYNWMKTAAGVLILLGFALFAAKDVEMVHRARSEGFDAGRSGASSGDCPHDPDSRGCVGWMWGWDEGSKARPEADGWERDWWVKPHKEQAHVSE